MNKFGDFKKHGTAITKNQLAELDGTIGIINPMEIEGKRILIIDDIYQSGTTMNYVGMLLLNSGASCIYGLSCEKTCSNQD